MRQLTYPIKRQPVRIHVVERPGDLDEFCAWLARNPVLGCDTESTGLNWWDADRDWHLRLVQFGTADEAYTLPVDLGEPYRQAARRALEGAHRLIAHNAGFDLHAIEAGLGIPLEALAPKFLCTKITAHLVDPRAVRERGPGLKLEELTRHYIDRAVADEVKGNMAGLARKYRTTKDQIWKRVDLFDDDYQLYAGMDPVLAYRLFHILWPKIPARTKKHGLLAWEHRLAHVTAQIERTGYLIDTDYAQARVDDLAAERERWTQVATGYGVANLNSNAQLISTFKGFGVELTKQTPKGGIALDDDVLGSISHPLAEAVIKARRAQKWSSTWFQRALDGRDSQDRVHPTLNSLQTRTARMTSSGSLSAQTFPAGDGYVRHTFIADLGHLSATIDFANMELRDLAGETQDPTMVGAFANNLDLHQLTADAAGVPRKVGKMGNFLTVFGGGWRALAQQAGVTEDVARRTLEGFNKTYPGVGALAKKLAAEARRTGYVYTPTGRRLPVDRGRSYASLNYFIQSGSRDITARALLRLHKAGYTDFMRMVVHDEIVFSFPREQAADMAYEAARLMEFTVRGVLIPADAEIGDRSWGSVLELEGSKH